jgi:O-antigen ligase
MGAAFFCALVIAVTFVTGYSDLYMDRFSGLEGNAHIATSGRSSIWLNALRSMMENPLSFITGYGFFSYNSSRSFRLATHNMYLSYLYNLGMIGLTLFLLMFSRILAAARAALAESLPELRPHLIALAFGLCGFLVAVFFSDYHQAGYLLWAYVGVGMRIAMSLAGGAAAGVTAEKAGPGSDRPAPAGVDRPGAPGWTRRDFTHP